jgi:hypothetical protein
MSRLAARKVTIPEPFGRLMESFAPANLIAINVYKGM